MPGGRGLLQRCTVGDLASLFVVLLFASLAVSLWKMRCLCVVLAAPVETPLYVYYTLLLCLLFIVGEGVRYKHAAEHLLYFHSHNLGANS